MIERYKSVCALAGVCGLVVGCGDPLEGKWESEDDVCGDKRHDFTIETGGDDITGDGGFWFATNGGGCAECDGKITGSESGDGKYNVDISFSGDQGCDALVDGDCSCKLSSDETKLSCDCDPPYGDVDFERVD